MKKGILLVSITLFASLAFGQEAQSVATDWIDKIIALIPKDGAVIVGIAALIEILLRYVPSANPQSLFLAISEFCKHMADLMVAISGFLDKIMGQKIVKAIEPSKYYKPPTKFQSLRKRSYSLKISIKQSRLKP